MKKICVFILLVCFLAPGWVYAKKGGMSQDCLDIATVRTDGSGDNRTKKRGGNYVSIAMNTLDDGEIIRVIPTSGTLKYVTLHARYEGGIWKTVYKGPATEFPVNKYLASQKRDQRCTHAIISVNGSHEKYEPVACEASIKVCEKKVAQKDGDCKDVATIKNDGTGDNRTKKRGGNYTSIGMDSLAPDQVIKVVAVSGTLKYVTLHARYEGGIWKTVYKGPNTEFKVSRYLSEQKKDNRCTHAILSVNGAHERYEPIACEAEVKVCGIKTDAGTSPMSQDWMKKESKVYIQVFNGQFVCAEGGGGGSVVANRSAAKEWETFTMIPMPGINQVAFKTYSGQFLCAESGGGRELVANRPWSREWETFTLVPMPGHNKVALKAHNGQFVCAENGGGSSVVANRSNAGNWETFILIPAGR